MSNNLPVGWGDRNNKMSEKDINLGGVAATKFGGRAKNAYDSDAAANGGDSTNVDYKTSDQVREYYLNEMQKTRDSASSLEVNRGSLNVPDLWGEREKEREIQAKQMGVFSRNNAPDNNNSKVDRNVDAQSSSSHQLSAEVALVQIATHTLEKMTNSLEGKRNINIPMEDRAAFAKALKGAMDALAKQS